jgi:hypothetical protein
MYNVHGDWGTLTETLLESFETRSEAIYWVARYVTGPGEMGGYDNIVINSVGEDGHTIVHTFLERELVCNKGAHAT